MKSSWLGRPEFTGMGNLATCHRTDCRGLHRRHDSRVAGESHELDLESLAVVIDVDHGSDVADFQAFSRHRRCQHNAIVFSNHSERLVIVDKQTRTAPVLRARSDERGRVSATSHPKRTRVRAIRRSNNTRSIALPILVSEGSAPNAMMQSRIDRSATIESYASLRSVTMSNDTLPQKRPQKWPQQFSNAAICSVICTFQAPTSVPWAQGVAGSNPVAPTNSSSKSR
jgi:hypothetical protein